MLLSLVALVLFAARCAGRRPQDAEGRRGYLGALLGMGIGVVGNLIGAEVTAMFFGYVGTLSIQQSWMYDVLRWSYFYAPWIGSVGIAVGSLLSLMRRNRHVASD